MRLVRTAFAANLRLSMKLTHPQNVLKITEKLNMSDDLVKRLRERADLRMLAGSIMDEAADRIEQLEAALERAIEHIGFWVNDGLNEARAALEGKKDE